MMATNRTNGFTTYDLEVHEVLDCISPNAERLYRKLLQRMNTKRGDREVFPSRQRLLSDCGFTQSKTLTRAILELERFQLISVVRPSKQDAQQKHTSNRYFLIEPQDLPTGSVLQGLVSQETMLREQKSLAEKERKAKKLGSQTTKARVTDTLELGSQQSTNKDEENYDEVNYDEADFFEKNEDTSISVKETSSVPERSSLEEEQGISAREVAFPVKEVTSVEPVLEESGGHVYNEDDYLPTWAEVEPIYRSTRGSEDDRLLAVNIAFPRAKPSQLESLVAMGKCGWLGKRVEIGV
jgi:hypothetical protein